MLSCNNNPWHPPISSPGIHATRYYCPRYPSFLQNYPLVSLLSGSIIGTPTKRQVSKRQVSKRPVSKHLKRQAYKTSGLQNVRFTKCQVYTTSGLQNVRLQKNIHIYSVLVVGGNPQVLSQPSVSGCLSLSLWMSQPVAFMIFNYIITFLLYTNHSIPQCGCSAILI
jgi:hypothetical protein